MPIKKIVDEADFAAHKNSERPVLFQFSAEWCGPCQSIEGNMEDFEKQYGDKIDFRYMDNDVFEDTDVWMTEEIANMPTFKVFQNGECKHVMFGTKLDKIEDMLKKFAA